MWGENMIYRAIASDWTASTIFSYHSGFPIALTGSGCGGGGILNQCMPSIVTGQTARVNGSYGKNTTSAPGSPNYIGNVQYFNPNAFTVATTGNGTTTSNGNYGTCSNTTSRQASYVGPGRRSTFRAMRRVSLLSICVAWDTMTTTSPSSARSPSIANGTSRLKWI